MIRIQSCYTEEREEGGGFFFWPRESVCCSGIFISGCKRCEREQKASLSLDTLDSNVWKWCLSAAQDASSGCVTWRAAQVSESGVCQRKRQLNCLTHDTIAATDTWIHKVRRQKVDARCCFFFQQLLPVTEINVWVFFSSVLWIFVYLLTFGNKKKHIQVLHVCLSGAL